MSKILCRKLRAFSEIDRFLSSRLVVDLTEGSLFPSGPRKPPRSRHFGHLPGTLVDLNSSMSPIRGDVKKKISPSLSERRRRVACIQPNLSSGEAVGSRRIPDKPGTWRFELDSFMTPWSFDAFGSRSYASKRVGFGGPTMVLSETRGL